MSTTTVTMTITRVPVSMNGQMSLVDCIVTVDFAELAAYHACSAAYSKAKRARMLDGTIEVKATNQRPYSSQSAKGVRDE